MFSTKANAAVGTQKVEKTFIFECAAKSPIPGIDPVINPTLPTLVAAGEEFHLQNVSVSFDFPDATNWSDEPMIVDLGSPNFKINSENQTNKVHTFLEDTQMISPPGHEGRLLVPLTPEGGVDVGPFLAGDEGKVTLWADEVALNLYLAPTLPLAYTCIVPENEKFLITTIDIDGEAPVITLNGDNPMIVKQGDPYKELGATAQDNFDGDVSDDIEISGDVDTDTIGTYTVTYTVSDSVGNEATVERTVNVVEPFGSWYTGEGPPSDSLGTNGDSYLDITTGDVYKRDPNTWTKVSNLKGDDGKRGSAILTGSGAPSADAGDVGDLYLDTNTGDLYEKTTDGWKKIANLQGPAGPQGPKGPKGSAGSGSGSGSGDDGSGTGKTKTSTSSDTGGKSKSSKGGKLPKTATSLPTLILIGTLLATTGGVLFLRRRKVME
ncbi:immunoglobulin-like domain-containing protein [Pueribacillus sp. YX66]|uniref:immunoglobulin-like domain-containing protein n=1 Tax=Pueribacillus sp. YX66 TaxID=3229242 RepID=UPI00358D168E